jgi:plasmid stabilization system protein ParE
MYARLVVGGVFSATSILEQHPFAGRVVPEYGRHELRELIRGNYRIVYRIIDDLTIDIITIHHCSRQLDATVI